MRQAHKISLSQAYQSRTAAAAEWNSAFAANPIALSGYRKAVDGRDEDITPEEFAALQRSMVGVMYLYDNAHYQFQEGFVSEEFWVTTRNSMKGLMSHDVVNAIILDRLEFQGRPEFQEVVMSIDEELRANAED